MQAHARRWIFAAVIYFCVAVTIGVVMGASGDHRLFPVHAHLNLLGWVSLALIGVIYHFFPQAGAARIATVQFWVHNAALIVMMTALSAHLLGNESIEPVIGMGSVAMLLSILAFAGNLFWKRA